MLLFKKYQMEHINMGHSFERLSVISPSIKTNNNFVAQFKSCNFCNEINTCYIIYYANVFGGPKLCDWTRYNIEKRFHMSSVNDYICTIHYGEITRLLFFNDGPLRQVVYRA
jgi:hypothetical protein